MSEHVELAVMKKSYFRIFLYLILLTALTVAVTTIHFGDIANIVVGVIIALLKAGLVIAIFMHIKFDRPFLRVFFIVPAFFFIIIVFALAVLGL